MEEAVGQDLIAHLILNLTDADQSRELQYVSSFKRCVMLGSMQLRKAMPMQTLQGDLQKHSRQQRPCGLP